MKKIVIILVALALIVAIIEILLSFTIIKGDVNNDKKVNRIDYLIVEKHIMGIIKLSKWNCFVADMDKNGTVDINDLAIIKFRITD